MQIASYQGVKVSLKNHTKIDDFLVIEAPLQININGKPYTVVMRTPNDDFDLIRGLLYAEDIYKETEPLTYTIKKEDATIPSIINVAIKKEDLRKGYLNKRTLLSVSSCGICGKTKLQDLKVHGKSLEQNSLKQQTNNNTVA